MSTLFNKIAYGRADHMLSMALTAVATRAIHSYFYIKQVKTITMTHVIAGITGATKANAIETLDTYTFHKAD